MPPDAPYHYLPTRQATLATAIHGQLSLLWLVLASTAPARLWHPATPVRAYGGGTAGCLELHAATTSSFLFLAVRPGAPL